MADNVTYQSGTLATPAAGTKVSADEDATNGQVQRVKLAVSADGSSTHIGADANGLQVQGAAADGAALAGNPVLIAGSDGTNAQSLSVNSTGHINIADGGNTITVDGTVTETNSAAILADTAAMDTNLSTLAGAVAGTEVQVDIVASLPAGTNAIGKLAANDGVDIGDVDVASLPSGVIDTNNSTTTPLAGNADYTGTWTDVLAYSGIAVTVFADQNSDANGLKLQFSSDGTNADIDIAGGFDYLASTGRLFQQPIQARYFRVVFQNAAAAQAAFRLQTLLVYANVLPTSIHRLDADVVSDRSAELVKAALIAQVNGSGDFVPIQANAGGILKVGGSVDVDSSALPTGASTAANQSTIIGHVDGIEALLTTIDADTSNLSVVGGGTETTAIRVTLASDSTGLISVDDNGGSLTVDNTNIDNLHSADFDTGAGTDTTPAIGIAVAANGGAAVITGDATNGLDVDVTRVSGTVTVDGSGVTQPVSAASLPLPSGAATAANQSTANSSLSTIAGAVAGTEMQADVLTMPGTAAEAAALPSVFVVVAGDDGTDTHPLQLDSTGRLQVDIAADSVGIGGGTQYTEDDAAAANPVGNAVILVRDDTPGALTSTDGDNVAQRGTNFGAAFVQVVDSSGNFINSFGGSGGTSHADDAAFSIGSASSITPTGYLADETTPDSVDEGDVGVPRMTLTRKPYAVITDGTNENNASVNSTGQLSVVEVNSAAILADTAAMDTNLATLAGAVAGTEVQVDIVSGNVTNAGTFAVQVDGAALTALQVIDNPVLVDDAAFTPATSSVMMAGFEYDDTTPDSVDEGDAGAARMSANRNIYMQIRDAAGNERGANVNSTGQLNVVEVNSAAILADTANMDTNLGTIAGAVAGTEMQVDVLTSALPSGAATAANQSTANSALSAIQTAVEIIDNIVAGSEAQVDVVGALPTGTNTIGAVNVKPTTSGGLSIFRSLDLDETEEQVKSSGGNLYGWYLYNNAAATSYIKFYNETSGGVTVGTTTPVMTVPVPAGSAANVEYTNGISFATGITVAATTGVADNNTGALAANDVVANIFYS